MTRNQAAALATIDFTEWHGIDATKVDPSKVPFGGTSTFINLKGDVLKVYADGTKQIVTSAEIAALLNR